MATVETSSTTIFSSPRYPSTRPIDQRWDRSRGIVFNNVPKTVPSDRVWSPVQSIIFAPAPATTRPYSSQRLGRSTSTGATASKIAPSLPVSSKRPPNPSSTLNTPWKAPAGFSSSGEEVQRLRDTNQLLKDRLEQQSQEVEILESQNKVLRNEAVAAKANEGITQRQLTAAKAAAKSAQETGRHQLARIDEHRDAARKEATQSIIKEHEQAMKQVKDQYLKQIQELEQQVADIRIKKSKLSEQLTTLTQAQLQTRDLAQQLRSRQERGVADRNDYSLYRHIFDELFSRTFSLAETLTIVKRTLEKEANLWNAASNAFQTSLVLRLFHQRDNYQHLKHSIVSFLDARAHDAEATAVDLNNLGDNLVADLRPLRSAAHSSRAMTRYHHFEDAHNSFETAHLAYRIHDVDPLRERRDSCKARAESIARKLKRIESAAGSSKVAQLQEERNVLLEQRVFWTRLVKVFEASRKLKSYEALLNEAPVEKSVFIRSTELAERLGRLTEQYWDGLELTKSSEEVDASGERLSQYRIVWRDLESKARTIFAELQRSLRKRSLLEHELCTPTQTEQNQHDVEILRHIDKARGQLNNELGKFRPDLRRIITNRTRRLAMRDPGVAMVTSKSRAVKQPGGLVSGPPSTQSSQVPKTSNVELLKRKLLMAQKRRRKLLVGAANKSPTHESQIERLESRIAAVSDKIINIGSERRALKRVTGVVPGSEAEFVALPREKRISQQDRHQIPPHKAKSMRARPSHRTIIQNLPQKPDKRPKLESSGSGLNLKQTASMKARHVNASFDMRFLYSHVYGKDIDIIASSSRHTLTMSDYMDPLPGATSICSMHDNITIGNGASLASSVMAPSYDIDRAPISVFTATEQVAKETYIVDGLNAHVSKQSIDFSPDQHEESKETCLVHRADGLGDQNQLNESSPQPAVESVGPMETSTDLTFCSEALTTLTYQIPPKDYRAAVMASPNTNAAYWSYRLYKGVTGSHPAVLYCTSFETAEKQAQHFLDQPILGFDLEWEPRVSIKPSSIKQNVSLVQLASEDKIGLFHLALFTGDTIDKLLPPTLRRILEASSVTKAGVNVRGDASRVERCLGVKMQGIFELSYLYKVVNYSVSQPDKINFRCISLADQVQQTLLLPLKKDENRVSAWSRKLNTQQTDYAASDAYAGFRLYHALDGLRRVMTPVPPCPDFVELNQPLVLGNGNKVFRSEHKAASRHAKNDVSVNVEPAEDEHEEFFDAVEELDPSELSPANQFASGIAVATFNTLPTTGGTTQSSVEPDGVQTMQSTSSKPTASNFTWQRSSNIVFASTPVAGSDSRPIPRLSSTRNATAKTIEPKSRTVRPHTIEFQQADSWLDLYVSSRSKNKIQARPNELRAYHLWHEQGYDPKDVAAFLKDPPLSVTTVASYVLQAVKVEGLPYDVDRMRNVLRIIPPTAHRRFGKIVDQVRGDDVRARS